jgi:hypothetical protein
MHDGLDVLAEVRAGRECHAVDAGLALALEEGRIRRLPTGVVADQRNGTPNGGILRCHAEVAQELERERRRGPGIEERLRLVHPARPVCAAIPLPIRTLQREQLCAPALHRDAGPLGGHGFGRAVREVAHRLLADRRIGVEQPIDDGHGAKRTCRGRGSPATRRYRAVERFSVTSSNAPFASRQASGSGSQLSSPAPASHPSLVARSAAAFRSVASPWAFASRRQAMDQA